MAKKKQFRGRKLKKTTHFRNDRTEYSTMYNDGKGGTYASYKSEYRRKK